MLGINRILLQINIKKICVFMMKMLFIDIDVDRISLFKQINKKYFIRYEDLNKMNIVPVQLKIKNFYYEIHDYNKYDDEMIYIENSDNY